MPVTPEVTMEKEGKVMIKKIKNLWENKQQLDELILYIVMGLLTTIVNYVVYFLCHNLLGIYNLLANMIAWVLAVLFAFATNRKYVFKSEKKGLMAVGTELIYFASGRLISLIIFDIGLFHLLVNILHFNDLAMKLLTNVGVVVFNYFVGKFLVFKKS